jgi:signal transduction histidine kinase/DNA-binding response OmpR family regulator
MTVLCAGQSNEMMSIDSVKIKAHDYRQIAYDFEDEGKFDSAMYYAIKALRLSEEINDSIPIFKTMHHIGMINIYNENFDAAQDYFDGASPIAIALDDNDLLASHYHHLGLVYQKKTAFSEVIPNYEKALVYYLKMEDYIGAAIINGNIGSTYMDQRDFEASLPYLKKALSLKEEHGAAVSSICHTLLDICELNLYLANYPEAILYAEKAINLAYPNQEYRYLQYAYLFKSEAEHNIKQNDSAYKYLLKYTLLKDSLFNEAKAKQIQELQISYESEKKDLEIASLEQAKELEKSRKRLFMLIGLAILLIAIVVYFQQRSLARKNKKIREKEQKLDEMKSNFFANISHEFRTPLTLILGPIQSKIEKESNPEALSELKMMERNTIRLQRLISDILDLAKNEDGKLELHVESIILKDLLSGLSASFESLAESKNIHFEVFSQGIKKDQLITIDKRKLEIILLNLLSNAFKFTADGGEIQFSASVEEIDSEKGLLHLSLKDSGIGIAQEKLKQVFNRFFQVDDSATRKEYGTGIGLAFTKELVELMGGKISVESEEGVGSVFNVELPLSFEIVKEQELHEEEKIAKSLHLKEAMLSLDTIDRVENMSDTLPLLLLVEDNADLSHYIQSLFLNEYQVHIAENGEKGLELALSLVPDLIISDIMMPVMDGYELCKSLKTNIVTSHIPVMLLSAKSSVESRITGLETEADVYMSKPFNPKELQLQVRNIFKQQQKLKAKFLQSEVLIPDELSSNSVEQQFITKLSKLMEEKHQDPTYSVEQLSADIGLSRSQLHRKLQAIANTSASRFIRIYRLKKAMKLLKEKSASISEIAYDVGFNSVSYFNKCFLETFGHTPGEA